MFSLRMRDARPESRITITGKAGTDAASLVTTILKSASRRQATRPVDWATERLFFAGAEKTLAADCYTKHP